jgi:hypothetical protein
MNDTNNRSQPASHMTGEPSAPITIVSGLPRSGTSMMMQMLEAGGMPVCVDHLREADVDNPRGYYECERVKGLDQGDTAWLQEATGKAIKIVSALLVFLPRGYTYRIILMRRRMDEILASQRKMLASRGEPGEIVSDDRLAELFAIHLEQVRAWLAAEPGIAVLEVDYNEMVSDAWTHAQRVNRFLGGILEVEQMAAAVNPELYRNRGAGRVIPSPGA